MNAPSTSEVSNFQNEENLILDPVNWEVEEDEPICICFLPKTDQLIACSSEICPIGVFHADCVGLTVILPHTDEREAGPSIAATAGEAAGVVGGRVGSVQGKSMKRWSWYCEFCSAETDGKLHFLLPVPYFLTNHAKY